MSGIMNKTARQFNLKCVGSNGNRVTVRIAPGFNIVDEKHWKAFVDGKKVDPYVASLKKRNFIDFGPEVDDKEMDQDADTVSKSKSLPTPKKKKKATDD